MRITAKAKQETEQTIRSVARKLFIRNGLERTSTRDIATAAGIAVGTLFNYFPSKEALAVAIDAKDDFTHRHLQRVAIYADAIGREMGLADDEMKRIGALKRPGGSFASPAERVPSRRA